MDISLTKIELTKKLLNTTDKDLINYLKAIFSTQSEDWWEETPDEIKESINRGLKQADKGQTLSHAQVMKKHRKWLKK